MNKSVTLGDIERLVIGEENSKNGESQSDKGIIIHGALKSAWLAQLMIEFAGVEGNLRQFNVSYRGVDFPNENLKYYDNQLL